MSLVREQRTDTVLVSSLCGGQVPTHSLLLALHSPLLARLLIEAGTDMHGLTLPFPLTVIKGLLAMMHMEEDLEGNVPKGFRGEELMEAADCLGICLGQSKEKINGNSTVFTNIKNIKMEVASGNISDEDMDVDKEKNLVTKGMLPLKHSIDDITSDSFNDKLTGQTKSNLKRKENNIDDELWARELEMEIESKNRERQKQVYYGSDCEIFGDDDPDYSGVGLENIKIKEHASPKKSSPKKGRKRKPGSNPRKKNFELGIMHTPDGNMIQTPEDLLKFMEQREGPAGGPMWAYVCLICKHSWGKKENAKVHIEAVHFKGLFHYACDECNKDFPALKALRNHNTLFHPKSKEAKSFQDSPMRFLEDLSTYDEEPKRLKFQEDEWTDKKSSN